MDVEDQIVTAVGALAGAVVTYKITEGQEIMDQAPAIAVGAVLGAALVKIGYDVIQDYNPLIG